MPIEQSITLKTLTFMAYTLAVCLLAIVIGRVAGVFDNEPVLIVGAMVALTGAGCWLARSRFWPLAGYIPIAVVFAVGVYGSEGSDIATYVVLFYGIAVLLAAALKPLRVAWVVLVCAVAVHLGLTSAGNTLDTVLAVGITFGGCLAGILLVESLFVGELRKALGRAESAAHSLEAEIQTRRKAEADLVDREQDLRSILSQNSDGIAVTDQSGFILDWNPAMEALTGLPKEHVLGNPFREVFGSLNHEPDARIARLWKDAFQRVLEGAEPHDQAVHRNVHVAPSGGNERLADLLLFRVEGPSGVRGVLSARDVTTQHRLEAEREKVAQLESLGILAGGLAHDFNNLLLGIRGSLSLARSRALEGRVEPEALKQAEAACDRAHDLANRLLTFAKGGAPIVETLQVVDCIREAVNNVSGRSNDRFEWLPTAESLPKVRADRTQLRQAIQNVVQNAVEATADDTPIKIKTERADFESPGEIPVAEGTFVVISITDCGPGIADENKAQIFDPYFTTKTDAEGLGLATAYSILRRHGGHIATDSELGLGTTFRLYVPAESGKQRIPAQTPSAPKSIKRVLVVDDEETVRNVVTMMLKSLGYDTTTVADGQEALRAYDDEAKQGTPFDVVIMDLTIKGGMDGTEVLRLIRERYPHVTAIVSSGYSSDPVMASFADYGFKGVIAKPYSREKLGEVLANLTSTPE